MFSILNLFEEAELPVREHVKKLLGYMTEGLYEKEHIMAMAVLSAIAGESIFLLGPPGTAKSMVARRLKMVFKDSNAFEYLMSRFSTPDEIFGPVSIAKLKNEDKYERLIDGYLPNSTIVFLDEIWKAGPSIQNALLTAINEHIFQNGAQTINVPMKALIAASNELPAEDEGLEALWDRFLVREVSNCISKESTFYKMVKCKKSKEISIPSHLLITDEMYSRWQQEISNIEIPDAICRKVTEVRKLLAKQMKESDGDKLEYYISDRRWRKIFNLMQTSAFLNGRKFVDMSDVSILFHTLWNKVESIPTVLDIVAYVYVSEIEKGIKKSEASLDKFLKEKSKSKQTDNSKDVVTQDGDYEVRNYFYYELEGNPNNGYFFAKADVKYLKENTNVQGIVYYSERLKRNVVHAIYNNSLFDYKGDGPIVGEVMLKKCDGGIIIDGVPCPFKRKKSMTDNIFKSFVENDESLEHNTVDGIYNNVMHISEMMTSKVNEVKNMENLFVSPDDIALLLHKCAELEKEVKRLLLKVENTKMFYDNAGIH